MKVDHRVEAPWPIGYVEKSTGETCTADIHAVKLRLLEVPRPFWHWAIYCAEQDQPVPKSFAGHVEHVVFS